MAKNFVSKSEAETINFGKKLGRVLRKGHIIALCGELGSGKTVLTKGIARGLGVKSDKYVNSPSFVILKEHKGRLPLYHFDAYRLKNISEFSTVDYTKYFYGEGVCVIEWADKINRILPENFLKIKISAKKENERKISLLPHGKRYRDLAEKLC